MRPLIALMLCFCWTSVSQSADAISLSDRKLISEINQAVSQAGKNYAAGRFEQAGESIRTAMKMVAQLSKNSPDLVSKVQPAIARIQKAHTLLEFEGVNLPSFQAPTMATNQPDDDKPDPKRRPLRKKTVTPNPNQAISTAEDPFGFATAVAPILARRCGKCHIEGSRGGFNMKTFAALMKGPPEGVVIFPGDTIGSRLIETIETGDMPRGGGKVTPQELQVLKTWIAGGAKFDGTDPAQPILASAATTNNTAANDAAMQTKRATGNETVSFAKDVAGLLIDNCNGCHIDARQTRGNLNMDSFASLLRGGDSGSIIQPGNAEASLLIKKLRGTEGDRMPAGGRPPLSEDEIQLIATWINEGAALDGSNDRQPLRVMNQMAWAASASPSELSQRRAKIATTNLKLVASSASIAEPVVTDHFYVVGLASKTTLELVGSLAEKQIKTVSSVLPDSDASAEAFYRGRATIYVLPKRYDYSEFAKMAEQRSVPSDWQSHWKYNGLDAYIAMVATERDDEKEIENRLLTPLTALAVGTRGSDIPRWFAEGVGVVTAMRKSKLDRDDRMRMESETAASISAMKDAKSFLGGKMSPKQADRIGAAIATTMLSRNQRRNYDSLLRALEKGDSFDQAFTSVFRANPESFIDAWLRYVR
jgi:hypothetical protein